MKINLRCVFILTATVIRQIALAQCVPLPTINFVNPSFEGTPQAHVTPGPWSICMAGQTPDTQPGSWGITMPPTDGTSYLGLVHQASTGWQEGASEQVSTPFVAGTNYTFTIDIANVQTADPGIGILPGCAELQIWGGFGPCDDNTGTGVLLWTSGDITTFDTWQTYTVSFTPTQAYTWVMIRINSLGCTDGPYLLIDNISPIQPANVSIPTTTINQNIACPGMSNGMATVHAAGQFLPFTYLWNSVPAQTDSVLDNVPAGTYAVTVTDANTCTATSTIIITQPLPITLTPTTNDATCFGFNTGSAYMSYAGGTQPFTFLWSNNITTQNNDSLFAGTYNITATDTNGCSATASITITQPTQMSITGTTTPPTCNTGGSVSTTTTNGAPAYTYAWNTTPVQTTASITNLSGGTYIITSTDANSCTVSASFIISAPPGIPSVTLTPVNLLCFGQSTGSISSNPIGGSPAYTYSWSTTPAQTTPTATNLQAGNYSLTVTDANTCTASASATVSQPTALSVTTVKTDVLCFGQSTGSATATAAGGTAGYTYNWNSIPAQATPTASNLPAGTFNVTATDANSCTATSTATINQPASALSLSETSIDVLCFGGNTGSATLTATGGTSGYTYSWNTTPVQTTAAISNLIAGTYAVTATDANNCTAGISTIVTQPASAVSVAASQTAPTCFGQPLASATATASGGIGGYSYAWNTTPAQNTQSISNVPPGTYTVTATDANNCTATASITIAPPPTQLVLTVSHTDVLCFGASTGSVTVNASGSFGNYSYSWNSNPVQTTATAAQLPAGTYSVTVTDIQGCSATTSDVVSQPAAALSLSTTKTDILCFGDATGSATVTANGGTAAYNCIWSTSPQQTGTSIASLIAGSYSVTVTDANSCVQTATETIIQPTQLTATHSIINLECNSANDGSITIAASGGTTAYSYQWSVVPSVNSPTASGLAAGSYSATVTDANSCSVSIANMTITEPPALTLNLVAIVEVSCPNHSDGSITVAAGGGTPAYTFNWSNGGSTTEVNSNLPGGTYDVTLTDNNGCTTSVNNLVVAELPGVSLNAVVTNIPCAEVQNGTIDVTASSSFMPLTYTWSNGGAGEDLANLNTGTYSVTITDQHNCTVGSSFFVGNDNVFSMDATPDVVTINLGQSVNLNVTAFGSSFGSVIWTPSNSLNCSDCVDPISSTVESITYHVTGTDVNGCIANDTVRVNVIPLYTVYIPNAFTPNGDGSNDFFEVFGYKEAWKQFQVQVFNRWGEKVYESNDMNFKWDGVYRGQMMNPTVLVYVLKLVYLDNYTEKLHKGTVSLIR